MRRTAVNVVIGERGTQTDPMLEPHSVTSNARAPKTPEDFDSQIRFQQPHLERVSRSFAFGIARLEKPLRVSVGLGYLICRILDTVEDAHWASRDSQAAAFAQFEKFLTDAGVSSDVNSVEIQKWATSFPTSVSPGERLLLDDAPIVFKSLAEMDAREREALLEPIRSMSRGMAAYATRETSLRLRDLVDVNVYCFFVAGVVGELLTGLVAEQLRPIGLKLATHFGLFLQKINVLKDQRTDEIEGRFLVPDRAMLFESLRADAEGAMNYLLAIPVVRRDYRLFCAWALFLGLATVPLLRQGGEKLSRLQALAIGARIELAISDDGRLQALFDELAAGAWDDVEGAGSFSAPSDEEVARARAALDQSYSGKFDRAQLAALLAGRS